MTKDVFRVARIITKADIKDELRKIATRSDGNKLDAGIDFVLAIVTGISDVKVEQEIYAFIADVLESNVKDIEESDPMVLINRFKNDEGHEQWADFFTNVTKLITKEV